MLAVIDVILGEAPVFKNHTLVAFPITAVLIGAMDTEAGYRMFANTRVNAIFKKILNVWFQFLCSPRSCHVLNEGSSGWFGPAAVAIFPDFVQTFVCDPEAPYYGFESFEDFFTRRFRPGVRPIHFPHDDAVGPNKPSYSHGSPVVAGSCSLCRSQSGLNVAMDLSNIDFSVYRYVAWCFLVYSLQAC